MNDVQPRDPIAHDLKCWPGPFEAIVDRVKTFEVRKVADRDFQVGDTLLLKEWAPCFVHGIVAGGRFTEREIAVTVTYVLTDSDFPALDGHVVMGIVPVQQQEQTPLAPPVHLTVKGQHGDTVTIHITEAEHGLHLQASGDGESAAEVVKVTGDVQWATDLSESQREALLVVAEVAADLAVHAEAIEVGACSSPSADDLRGWSEELAQPARLLEALFDLAPKESTPEPQEGADRL